MTPRKRIITGIVTIVIILSVTGCRKNGTDRPKAVPGSSPVEKTFTLGGAPIKVVVTLSHSEIDLTDYLTVGVKCIAGEEVVLTPPYLSEKTYKPLLLVENPKEKTYWTEDQKSLVREWTYTFEPIESGQFDLKPFSVYFRLKKEKPKDQSEWPVYQVETEKIPYRVKSVDIGKTDDIRDIKGLILPDYNYIPPLATVAVFILIAAGYWWIRRKMTGGRQKTGKTEPAIDFKQEALKLLRRLESRNLIETGEFDRFHTELSMILRVYIENAFGLKAKKLTTEEFINDIRLSSVFNTEQQAALQEFLRLSDLVKFATFTPGSDVNQQALGNVRHFIETSGVTNEV